MKAIDISNQRFGSLLALNFSHKKNGYRYWNCLCDCGNIKAIPLSALRSGRTVTCTQCFKPKIGKRFSRLVVIDNSNFPIINCKCDCGKLWSGPNSRLISKYTQSCGCYKKEQISKSNTTIKLGTKYGRLTVIQRLEDTFTSGGSLRTNYLCRCDCGVEKLITSSSLTSGSTQSCGCYNKQRITESNLRNLTGKRFGKLLVQCLYDRVKTSGGYEKVMWFCECDCGQSSIVRTCDLTSKRTNSCGNCAKFRNGQLVSQAQINIAKSIGGIINYKTLGFYLDIAMVRNCKKIAIEYDEWYWHGGKIKQDDERRQKLLDNGWKVFRIRTSNVPPDINLIIQYIDILSNTKTEFIDYELNWGNGKIFQG